MTKTRALTVALVVAALAVALAACGDDDGPSTAASSGGTAKPVELRIGGVDPKLSPVIAVLELAQQKGWWAEEGLKVSILPGVGGGNITQALITGSTDLAIASPLATVSAAQKSADVTLIGSLYNYNAFSWVALKPDAALKGATLGYTSAGSAGQFMVDGYARAHPELGIKGQAVGSFGDMLAALKAGRITAMLSVPPFTAQLLDQGGHVLVTGRDMVGDVPANLVAVNTSYAKAHGAALEAFWRVIDRGFRYYLHDPKAAAAELAPIVPVDQKYLLDSIEGDNRRGLDISTSPEALANLDKLLAGQDTIHAPVDWAKLLDQQYLPKAARADLHVVSAG